MTEEVIEEMIKKETIRFRKRVPFLKDLRLTISQNSLGQFISKSFFKSGKKTVFLKTKSDCPKQLIKKSFSKIANTVSKRKNKKPRRFNLIIEEAA